VPSTRREQRAARETGTGTGAERERRSGAPPTSRAGDRPRGPFGPLPVSEFAILMGFIAIVVGFVNGGGAALLVGLIVCALGVVEITAREHFSGYRSHTALLSAIPAIALEAGVVAAFGEPHQRALLLAVALPVFAILFFVLRRRFASARQARIARSARPSVPRAGAG
jgi:hypothetical protein